MAGAGCRVPQRPLESCDRRNAISRMLASAVVILLASASPARGDVRDFLGRTLIDVRVEVGGVALVEPSVLQLVETRIGQPLSMEHVRQTIDHLVGLGRFDDVRVFAETIGPPPGGVSVRWVLAPIQHIGRIDFAGRLVLSDDALRREVDERLGSSPVASRVGEIVQTLTDYYHARGYRQPAIAPRLIGGDTEEVLTLVLSIDAGPQTVVGNTVVRGEAGRPADAVIADLHVEPGQPFDRVAVERRMTALEGELRDLGYYEANVEALPEFSDREPVVKLTIDVERGPRVRVVFTGDPLPEARRNELVPIRQERSVDLDLLEDASRNIEAFLRQQGYQGAEAPYVREEKGGELILTFNVARGPLHRVASLEVEGNRAVTRADIAPVLAVQPGEPFVASRITRVATAVTELYRQRGFAQASVKTELSILPERRDDEQTFRPVEVRLIVTEGSPTIVSELIVEGAQAIAEQRIRAALGLVAGQPFYRPQMDADRDAIERVYQNEGFRGVEVQPAVDVADEGRRVVLRWRIKEGPRSLVDHVLVTGNRRTSDELIRREIAVQPGQPLGDELLIESQRRLAALGLFRRVRIIELPHGSSPNRDVLIEIEEAPSTTISYGGGVEAGRRLRPAEDGGQAEERIEVAPRGFFEISRRNLWGKNRSISLLTRVSFRPRDPAVDSTDPTDLGGYGFNEYRVLGTFREPRPFNVSGDLQLTAFIEQAIRSSFNFNRRGVRAEYARRVREALRVSGRYSLDRTRLFDEKIQQEDQVLIDRLFPRVRLSTLTGSLLRDSRDDVIDPERGAVLGFDTTVAARALGSEVGFLKTFMQAFGYRYLPNAAGLTFAAGLRLGFAWGFERLVERRAADGTPILSPDGQPVFDVVDDVPASERFFAGGDTTVRGFVLDRLGTPETRNADGFPTGGNGLVVVNLEMRSPYWKGLGGVGFFDMGNVFKDAGDVRLGDLRPTAGFGVRYRSPIGPVRADLGFNLDRQLITFDSRERGMVFHISLGQAF